MRRQKNKCGTSAVCGSELNLSLQWTYQEYGGSERGFWSVASGLLWSIRPQKLMAAITVHNREYVFHSLSREGLPEGAVRELKERMKALNLRQAQNDWFQD